MNGETARLAIPPLSVLDCCAGFPSARLSSADARVTRYAQESVDPAFGSLPNVAAVQATLPVIPDPAT